MKLGDVDPRGERRYVDTISDKASVIGGGVLEAILHLCPSIKLPA
jgi:xanthine dehydrogenase accessory factor